MKIVTRTIILFVLALTALPLSAQKSTFKRGTYLRNIHENQKAENYSAAVSLIDEALQKFPDEAANDPEFHFLRSESMRGLMLQEARKMYLKQSTDTAKYFSYIYEMFKDGIKCDSLADLPNEKGKVRNPYHKTLIAYFTANMKNLYNAGKFAYKNGNYQNAVKYASIYIGLDGEYKTDAATIAVLSAFAAENYSAVDQFLPLALADSTIRTQLFEIASRSYAASGNNDKKLEALILGWTENPEHEYFYLNLIDIYNSRNDYSSALELTKKQIETDPHNRDFWYVRGKSEMFLELYDEALTSFNTATTLLPHDASSFSAIGNIFLKRSQDFYNSLPSLPSAQQKLNLRNLQLKAKEAFESARKFNPTDKSLWLTGLKEIYFKLNMGKELKELEK